MKKLMIWLSMGVMLQAQMPMDMMPPEMEREHREIERYRSIRMAEYMDLSPEQSDRFFPRWREHREKMREIHRQMRQMGENMAGEGEMVPENLTAEELELMISSLLDLDKKQMSAREAFLEEMQEYLQPYQVARYMFFEHAFRQELQQTMKKKWKSMNKRRN